MHFFRAFPWHRWSLADLEGNHSSLIVAMFLVILLWIAVDRTPAIIKYK